MKPWIWHIKLLLGLVFLFVLGCSTQRREELIVFEDSFYADAQCEYDQLIQETLRVGQTGDVSPFDLLPGLYGAARMYWLVDKVQQLNNAVQKQLLQQFQLYADIPNMGAGVPLYSAILALKQRDFSNARRNLKRFYHHTPEAALIKWASHLEPLVSQVQPATHKTEPMPNKETTRSQFIEYYLKPWINHQQPLGIVRLLNRMNIQNPMRRWEQFLRFRNDQLLFAEEVRDTSRNAIIKKIKKYYFNPFLYESIAQFYREIFVNIAHHYLTAMDPSWVQELDSTDIQAFYYLNLYLAETAALFNPQLSKQFIKIMETIPFQTPLTRKTTLYLKELLSGPGGELISELELDGGYDPFYTAYLKARLLRLDNHLHPGSFNKKLYDEITGIILDNAPNETFRNQTLALLGESACPIARWEIAIQLLSPTFDRGYDVTQVDPVKMVYMANAYFHHRLQMDGGKGILEQLIKCYSFVKPLRYDYIRVLTFLYAK